jgi:hypothetical protein
MAKHPRQTKATAAPDELTQLLDRQRSILGGKKSGNPKKKAPSSKPAAALLTASILGQVARAQALKSSGKLYDTAVKSFSVEQQGPQQRKLLERLMKRK